MTAKSLLPVVIPRRQIIKANSEPVDGAARSGDASLICHIYVDDAISELATRRSEFAAILKNERIDRLPTLLCPRGRHQL
jgi:hypothetical protein